MRWWLKMGATAVLGGMLLATALVACQAAPADNTDSTDTPSVQTTSGSAPEMASSVPGAPSSMPGTPLPDSGDAAESPVEPLRIYPVDLAGFEKPLADGVEIPLYNPNGSVEDDIANWTGAFSYVSKEVVPAYKTEAFEYGAHYTYDISYGGVVQITTQDGLFGDTVAHRYDAKLLKDGQGTGMTWRYYATPQDGLFYFLDETEAVLRYIVVGNIVRLEGDTTISWQGMDADQVAEESTDDALMAYETFFGVTANADTHVVSNCLHIIQPSQSEEDWYHMYLICVDQGDEAWDDGVVVGLIYMNQADPAKWMVYDDAARAYVPLVLVDGRFEEDGSAD